MATSSHRPPRNRSSAPRDCGRAGDEAAAGLHHGRVSSLGKPGTPTPPVATRVTRAGWRDPRLWIGLLIVAGSVVLGARLLAAADEPVSVWAVVGDHGVGAPVGSDDVVAVRVRFADDADLDRYLPADDPLPDGIVLARAIGSGELLPRAAIDADADVGTVQVPLDLEPTRVPPVGRRRLGRRRVDRRHQPSGQPRRR